MTIIYCAKSDRTDIARAIDNGDIEVDGEFRFKSPQDVTVDHSATHVLIANDYGNVRDAYAGICSIELIGQIEDETEAEDEEE